AALVGDVAGGRQREPRADGDGAAGGEEVVVELGDGQVGAGQGDRPLAGELGVVDGEGAAAAAAGQGAERAAGGVGEGAVVDDRERGGVGGAGAGQLEGAAVGEAADADVKGGRPDDVVAQHLRR